MFYAYSRLVLMISSILGLLQDDLDHLISQLGRLWEPRLKVFLDLLKLLPIAIEVTQTDTRAPVSGGEGKLQVIGAESVVIDSCVDGLFE